MALKRIQKELNVYAKDPYPGITFTMDPRFPGDYFHLLGSIIGESGTPYEDGLFFLSIELPKDYPFRPPNVKFLTPVCSPNIDRSGGNCLDIFDDSWSPALTIPRTLLSLQTVLSNPDYNDSLDPVLSSLFKADKPGFLLQAKAHTRLHAY